MLSVHRPVRRTDISESRNHGYGNISGSRNRTKGWQILHHLSWSFCNLLRPRPGMLWVYKILFALMLIIYNIVTLDWIFQLWIEVCQEICREGDLSQNWIKQELNLIIVLCVIRGDFRVLPTWKRNIFLATELLLEQKFVWTHSVIFFKYLKRFCHSARKTKSLQLNL